jgi:hypothetical protein
MLEFMETKECHDFLGGCLGGNEITMAQSGAYASMLESSYTLVMEHGYDSATSQLEKVLMMSEMIESPNLMQD